MNHKTMENFVRINEEETIFKKDDSNIMKAERGKNPKKGGKKKPTSQSISKRKKDG